MRVATGTLLESAMAVDALTPGPSPERRGESRIAPHCMALRTAARRAPAGSRGNGPREPLAAAECLDADDPRLALLDDLVDQQERIAMWDGGQDFLAIH